MGNALAGLISQCDMCGRRKDALCPSQGGVLRLEELSAAFHAAARPSDGMMDRKEYSAFVEQLGLTKSVARQLWVEL